VPFISPPSLQDSAASLPLEQKPTFSAEVEVFPTTLLSLELDLVVVIVKF
jgi:hypothetical protein